MRANNLPYTSNDNLPLANLRTWALDRQEQWPPGTGTLASAHPSGALTHLELKFGPMLYIPTGHVLLAFWYGTPLVLPLADPFGVSYAPIVVPEVHHRATVIPRCSRPIRRQAPWLHSHTVVGHQQGSQRRIQLREAALIG